MNNSCSFAITAIDLWYSALSWWKSTFSFSFVDIFWPFFPSNTPIMLYNICYWWFFLSQGNWWTKYLAHPKIQRPKSCLLMFASLVALNNFHLLLSTQLTTNLTLEWSGGSMFHPLSHIYAKPPFFALKQLQTTLWITDTFLIDCEQTQHPLSHWQMFMQNGEYTAFWYLQLLCYHMQLQFTISKMSLWSFLVFSGTTAEFGWPEIQNHLC